MALAGLAVGNEIRRVELHERFGGRRQGGISPSKQTPNVFVFSNPATASLHGYLYDGWREDEHYHYTGEGQLGDQQMNQGNRAIRDHQEEGRALHVFESSGSVATYLGEFEYVDHYPADAPETRDGRLRKVFVFRLRPVDAEPGPSLSKIDELGDEAVKEVPVEEHLTEATLVNPDQEPRTAERREQRLVRELMATLRASRHEVCRLQLRPKGEPAPLFCDLFDKTANKLYEAKGTVARPAIRMAIGQLADYARLIDPSPARVIVVPSEPRPDLIDLAKSQDIEVLWPGKGDFHLSGD